MRPDGRFFVASPRTFAAMYPFGYTFGMRFEWDDAKNVANRRKHGVSFETARLVFDDPCAISIQDRNDNGEEPWQTIGRAGGTIILLVAHTVRDDDARQEIIRIISARKATPRERRVYEHNHR